MLNGTPIRNSNRERWTLVRRLIWLKATVLAASGADWQTVTDAIVSFNAPKAHPLKELVVNLEPVQSGSGDPSPNNVRPISGWTGVKVNVTGHNVWDEEWEPGLIDASNGQNTPSTSYCRTKNYLSIIPSFEYYLVFPAGTRLYLRFYDIDKNYLGYTQINSARAFTPSGIYPNSAYLRFCWDGQSYGNDISITYPSTDHDYHAYNGQSISVIWEDTVFGGSAEVVDGDIESTWLKKVVSDADVIYVSSDSYIGNVATDFWVSIQTYKGTSYLDVNANNARSETLKPVATDLWNRPDSYVWAFTINSRTQLHISVDNATVGIDKATDTRTTAEQKIKTWLASNPLVIVYKVATTSQFSSTPTPVNALQGLNNVWSDAGDVTVTFRGTPIEEPDAEPLQALNLLLGGAYRNDQTPEDVPDDEALDILLGGADR